MTFDDLKIQTVKDQPDEKSNGKKAKGLQFLYSPWWCLAAATLGVLCLGLVVTIMVLGMQRLHPASNFLFQFSILDGAVSEEPQLPMALGGRFSFDAPLI
uniref:Uncharacterized protein n=1 Tax=Gorilla gorilla gorilla TaxID=9595 RepID=A0A2I2YN16_GORGO